MLFITHQRVTIDDEAHVKELCDAMLKGSLTQNKVIDILRLDHSGLAAFVVHELLTRGRREEANILVNRLMEDRRTMAIAARAAREEVFSTWSDNKRSN